MATQFSYIKSDVKPDQLQREINDNVNFTATCVGINFEQTTETIEITFSVDLTNDEETLLQTIVNDHQPEPDVLPTYKIPTSRTLEGKLAVHSSPKPEPYGVTTYAVWTGCGDDITAQSPADSIGNGELLSFDVTSQDNEIVKEVKFDPRHGRVWIHEAYITFQGAGVGDYVTSEVVAPATQLQQVQDLSLYIEDNWIKAVPPPELQGSPQITATHGFAGIPVLLPRSFSKDGDWDFNGVTLAPNFDGTGEYKLSNIDRVVHRFVNKIPCLGNSAYVSMSSDETAELLIMGGAYLRLKAVNVSQSDWQLAVFLEIYRQRTNVP